MPDVVVVGAGQAGLGMGLHLTRRGIDHVILERGRVGETWRTQRWDSFVLNTPNWMNALPGRGFADHDRDGFAPTAELVASFEDAAAELEVRTGTDVTRLVRTGDGFSLDTSDGKLEARAVVVASGNLNVPRVPPLASDLPDRIHQVHTAGYRSPDALPPGAVLVVGGGQSGAQIVESLFEGGREVFFSISRVARFPRRYRGRDFMEWMDDLGIWDVRPADADDPAVLTATNPLTSGVGARGHTISYQWLARRGVRLAGRLESIEGDVVHTDGRVADYVAFADERSDEFRASVDQYVVEHGLDVPDAELDEADRPAGDVAFVTDIDLAAAAISTVVWATGFGPDHSWIELPILDERGQIANEDGVTDVEGIYCLGFGWTSNRRSGVIAGIDADAARIAERIDAFL